MSNVDAATVRAALEGKTIPLENGIQVSVLDGKTVVEGEVRRLPGMRWSQLWATFSEKNPEEAARLAEEHKIVVNSPPAPPIGGEKSQSQSTNTRSTGTRTSSPRTKLVDVAERPNNIYYDQENKNYVIRLTESQKAVFRQIDAAKVAEMGYGTSFDEFMNKMNELEVGQEAVITQPNVMVEITDLLGKYEMTDRSKTALLRRMESAREHWQKISTPASE